MKNLKTIFFSLCLISSVLGLTSCDNDDDEKTAVYLPSKIEIDGNRYYLLAKNNITTRYIDAIEPNYINTTIEYTYDNQNRIVSELYYSGAHYADGMVRETKFVYNNQNKVSEIITNSSNISDTLIVTYKGSVITATDKQNTDYQYIITTNSSGLPITIEYPYFLINNCEYDSSWNLIDVKQTITQEGIEQGIEAIDFIYKYDNENGIFKNVKSPAWSFLFLAYSDAELSRTNNYIAREIPDYQELTTTYEYNEDGYPTTYKITDEGRDYTISTRKVEYIKK